MKDEDLDVKRGFIIAYFADFAIKIKRVEQIYDLAMIEEAVILACCYIEALANHRYNKRGRRDNFIKFLQNYSGHGDALSKISIPFLLDRANPNAPRTIGKLEKYDEIASILKKEFELANSRDEVPMEELIGILISKLPKLDKQNLKGNLNKFSHAAFIYERYRGPGVHFGGIPGVRRANFSPKKTDWDEEPGFYFYDWLHFKADSIINFLKAGHANLAKECEDKTKWPNELNKP